MIARERKRKRQNGNWTEMRKESERKRLYRWKLERNSLVHQAERRHEVCGATILIRRWIYGLNHRRIISDSRALLPPTETYACLFADNCTQLRARSISLSLSLSSLALSLVLFLSSTLRYLFFHSFLRYDVSGPLIRYQGFLYDVTLACENKPENRRASLIFLSHKIVNDLDLLKHRDVACTGRIR